MATDTTLDEMEARIKAAYKAKEYRLVFDLWNSIVVGTDTTEKAETFMRAIHRRCVMEINNSMYELVGPET